MMFISTVRRLNISYFDWQKALDMVYDKTNTCKDVKQLGVQKKTIDRPQKHLIESVV